MTEIEQPQDPKNVGDAFAQAMEQDQGKLKQAYQEMQKAVFADPEVKAFFNEHKDVLTREIVQRDFANLYEFYTQRQKQKRGEAVVHAGYVPQLIVSDHMIVVTYQPDPAKIKAQAARKQANMVRTVTTMPKLIQRAQLDDFDINDPAQNKAYIFVTDFIDAYLADPDTFHPGAYIDGPYGVGKTHLMGALANELAQEGVEVALVHFPTFGVDIRNAIAQGGDQLENKVQILKTASIVVIDDIGAESLNAWLRDDILAVILEYRMQNELTTFFTSNFSMAQLEKEHLPYTKDGNEPVKAERLMQRVKFLARPIAMHGENKRVAD